MLKKTSLVLSLMGMTGSFAMTSSPPSSVPLTLQSTQIQVKEFQNTDHIPIWLVENQDIPVLSLSFCFKNAGSKADPAEKKGLSQFLARILNEGCGNLDAQAFKKYLLENNINLVIDQSTDHFIIEFRCPKTNIKEAFHILKMMLTEPTFAAPAMERVKQQLFTELSQALHSERQVAIDLMRQRGFPSHPYGTSLTSQLHDLPTFKAEDFKNFMNDYLTKDQLIITAAGAIDPTQLQDFVNHTVHSLPAKTVKNLSPLSYQEPVTPGTVFVKEMDIPQSSILFFQPGIKRQDPDFYAAFVMMKILGEGVFDSRLWNEVREKQGLAYGISVSLFWNCHSSYILGTTATENKSVEKVLQIIRDQWQLMQQKGISADELTTTKEKMIGAYPLAFGSTYQIIGMLRMLQLDGLPANFVNERNALIANVTLDDVNRVAQKLLDPKKLTFIVVGKPEGLKAGESK